MVNVLIKNVDEKAYKAAKMLAGREDKNIGEVVSQAIFLFASQMERKGLLAVKPVDFGKGTENLSREIDKILYE
ncbi:TPA: hypothetical protein HA244_02440 [Candidatus Micrarchaeota archaeon]|nr:hypothetical protein [Candidatus Micrarchaeota archaeon]